MTNRITEALRGSLSLQSGHLEISAGIMRKLSVLLVFAVMAFLVVGAQAQQDDLWAGYSDFNTNNELQINGTAYPNTDSGWFNDSGIHHAGNHDYIAGYCGPSDCIGHASFTHGYFSFNLTSLSGSASTASFTVNNYTIQYYSSTLFLIGTSLMPSDVDSNQNWNDIGKYNALNMGPIIGSISLSPSDSNNFATITLNSDGLAWLDSHAGQGAVIGTEWVVVPEPGSLMFLGSGVLGLAGVARRRLLGKGTN
jgi:hypothetical protein